jgi:hypothetical protein
MKHKAGRGIDSPAVAAVSCPFCGAVRGVPCRRRIDHGHPFTPYVPTHQARIDKAAEPPQK